jgi:hypothetical protein
MKSLELVEARGLSAGTVVNASELDDASRGQVVA